MKDILLTIALMLFIAAGFYAFQLLILLTVGVAIYFALPIVSELLSRRKSWK